MSINYYTILYIVVKIKPFLSKSLGKRAERTSYVHRLFKFSVSEFYRFSTIIVRLWSFSSCDHVSWQNDFHVFGIDLTTWTQQNDSSTMLTVSKSKPRHSFIFTEYLHYNPMNKTNINLEKYILQNPIDIVILHTRVYVSVTLHVLFLFTK